MPRDVFDPFSRGALQDAAPNDPELADIISRMWVGVAPGLRTRLTNAQVLALAGPVVAALGLLLLSPFMPGLPPWFFSALYGLGFGLFFALGLQFTRRQRRRQIVVTLLGEGRCGSCAFRLEGSRIESDGCVVCGECGAAWRQSGLVMPSAERTARPSTEGDERQVDLPWLSRQKRAWSFWPTLEDANGRLLRMIDPAEVGRRPGGDGAAVGAERADALRSLLKDRTRGPRVKAVVLSALAVGFVIAVLAIGLRFAPIWSRVVIAAAALLNAHVLAMAVWRLWTGRSQRFATASREVFVQCAVCPRCGADLGESPQTGNGTIECRQCRAAWPVPGVTSN